MIEADVKACASVARRIDAKKKVELTAGVLFFPTFATLTRPLEERRPPSRPPAGFAGAGVTGAAASSS